MPACGTAIPVDRLPACRSKGALIIAAGTADLGPGQEAARTLAYHGHVAPAVVGVGVAGLPWLGARFAG